MTLTIFIPYLQTDATLVMCGTFTTFVISAKLDIQTNTTDITMEQTITMDSEVKHPVYQNQMKEYLLNYKYS